MVKLTGRENSVGYYYDIPKIGRAQLSRKYYDNDSRLILLDGQDCIPAKIAYKYKGGSINKLIGGNCFQGLASFLAPLGKNQLMAVIVLFVLNYFNKQFYKKYKQSGGNYVDMAEKTLAPLGKNALLVVAALLLFDYFTKNYKMKMKGGDNTFMKKIIKLLQAKHKQSGGMIINQLQKIVAPMGGNMFVATGLLILLNELFKGKKLKQKGGSNLFCVLRKLLMPLGINSFLVVLGLIALTKSQKDRKQKGGNNSCNGCSGCGGILNFDKLNGGYGCKNCGCGDNALEVVGDKALNYSLDYKQFGCKIPEWGYNLHVNGPDGQTKCI